MPEENLIRQLLQEMIISGRSLEEVCRDHPELLEELRARWQEVRVVEQQLDVLFPSSGATPQNTGSIAIEPKLPQIPGYEVLEVLGHGGMGVVYKAQHLALNRPIALKMVRAGAYASEAERQRLRREAQAVAALVHPNIVTVHDVGECDDRPFFTMEFVEGANLAQRLAGTPQLARDAAALIATLAEAVHFAHQLGIVHRDLKPANVLVTPLGTPKITDFGLARHFDGEFALTFTGLQVGTPSYMAPEQARGLPDALGPGVDIYSLGAMLYEMLTGRPPFRAATAVETQRQVIEQEPTAPSRLNPKVPRDLETICLKCLEKDPKRRYATALKLAEDLNRFGRNEPISARRVSALGRLVKWCRRRPTQATLVAAISLVAMATLLATTWWTNRQAAGAFTIQQDLEELEQLGRDSNWAAARTVLERARARDFASAALRERIERAGRDLELVQQLEDIRLNRAAVIGFGFHRRANNPQADAAYAKALRARGLGDSSTPPERVATQIQASAIANALIAALDDWAACTVDKSQLVWILNVARSADPEATTWRSEARTPAAWTDISALERLMHTAPVATESVQLLTALAERAEAAGCDVVSFLRGVQAAHPSDYWSNAALGYALSRASRFAEATRYYQSALSLRPKDATACNNLAIALVQDGRVEEAVSHLREAIRISPESGYSYSLLGNSLNLQGKFAEALEQHREAVRIAPGSSAIRANLGVALQNIGRLDEAIAEFRAAIQIDPKAPGARVNLGMALAQAGHTVEAIDAYRQTIELVPDDPNVYSALGRTLFRLHRMTEALDAFTTAVRLKPDSAEYHADRGVALAQLGQVDEAVECYERTLTIDLTTSESNQFLRTMLMEAGRGPEICTVWKRAITASPSKYNGRAGYAELCLFLDRPDDYRSECTILINRFGSSADAATAEQIAMAGLMAPLSETDAAAIAVIVEKARPEALLLRGLLEYRRNRLDAALPLLERARQSAPVADVGPMPSLMLALIAHHRGDDRTARKMLASAIPGVNWQPQSATGPSGWTWHIVRREAEEAIIPNWDAFLAGTHQPQDNDERLSLIGACEFRNLHHLTAKLYSDAFDVDSALAENRQNDYRYNAACYAMMAATGARNNAVRLNDEERAMWRAKARQWLREELASWKRASANSPQVRELALKRIVNWKRDPDLAGLRESEPLERLNENELRECHLLWAEIDAEVDTLRMLP
ncbi:Serine/threonine-protein kinase PknB [Phycisphaerae bacterium RAS2]|nr:Serine/threonine-protein kinase PknB [Phycisphaerae bacterium RAS2]